jgi:hypothetical protein
VTKALSVLVAACVLLARLSAQGLTGALVGTVRDAQGGVLPGAAVQVNSPSLIGGRPTVTTNDKGQLRFPALPPGVYELDIELEGFSRFHEEGIRVGAGATIERNAVLNLAGIAASIVVEGTSARIEARAPGFGTRFGPEDLRAIPTRRTSMFDFLRAAPGISPTSPGSGTATTVSAFGSGTNENQFLIDGTNFTCPCNGVARAEPGSDFIQEVQVQAVGASAEYGNLQGAVINVVTRQGSETFASGASYYRQSAALTSQPVRQSVPGVSQRTSGYERIRYRDFSATFGGPAVRERLWFFTGYEYLRDYDSQPGTDPTFPRTYEQDKLFAKLTWKLAAGMQMVQSLHDEFWVNPEQPTVARPFDATLRLHASVPAQTFGHLTHVLSANTVWDARVGRFVYRRKDDPSTGNRMAASRFDVATGINSGGPQSFGDLTLIRTTAKATISHYRPDLWAVDHEFKVGAQVERGEAHGANVIPTGVRFVESTGQPSQAISSEPSNTGGLVITAAAFASDVLTLGNRMTISAGLRFDHSRAISQDLAAIDLEGHESEAIVKGLGTLYTWNVVSPRLGATAKLTANGRTMMRASYGRFHQGVLTGENSAFHPGATPTTTADFVAASGSYRISSVVDPRTNLRLDSAMRAPRTDEYSIEFDREVGRHLSVATAYVHKSGGNFIGWTDAGGVYREDTRSLPDGRRVSVFSLANAPADRRFLLTNPDGYSLTYNGVVTAVEKRRSSGWQAFGSYSYSRQSGLQASSGVSAAAAQSSSVALPTPTFGRDPNDLTNARGLLANDRPHLLRVMGAVDVPRIGVAVAANFQYFSGKPWAASAVVNLPQNSQQRVLLQPRGSRRLPSQSLLDVRVSRTIRFRGTGRADLLLDILNLLNDAAEESYVSENLFSANFGQPNAFMDPRRAMVGVRLNLGR